MCVGRGARGGAWRPRGRGPRGVARAPGFVRCEAGWPGAAKARVRASACCASVYPPPGARGHRCSQAGGKIALLETEARAGDFSSPPLLP